MNQLKDKSPGSCWAQQLFGNHIVGNAVRSSANRKVGGSIPVCSSQQTGIDFTAHLQKLYCMPFPCSLFSPHFLSFSTFHKLKANITLNNLDFV